jgi:hypothetical protein
MVRGYAGKNGNQYLDIDGGYSSMINSTHGILKSTRQAYAQFDGVDDYISVPASTDFDVDGGLTIHIRVQVNSTGTLWQINNRGVSGSGSGWGIAISTTAFNFTTFGVKVYSLPISVTLGDWVDATLTYRTDGTVAAYIDYAQVANTTTVSTIGLAGANLVFGRITAADASINYYTYNIDEAIIYKQVLTSTEVASLEQSKDQFNKVGHWRFNNDATDSSNKNHHGAAFGGVTYITT